MSKLTKEEKKGYGYEEKKMLSATLCAVMVGSLAAPAFTVQAADDTLVYWSMWEATEPQGQVIQEAVDAYTEQTGVKVDLQFKGTYRKP